MDEPGFDYREGQEMFFFAKIRPEGSHAPPPPAVIQWGPENFFRG